MSRAYHSQSRLDHSLEIDGVSYYYITNLQGDVLYLVDASGNQVAAYTYDPYGKVLTAEGPLAETNPLRYRGYYYDSETGFYYLQSRYYDPQTGRFINADAYAGTGQGILGYNMFAYCGNCPINRDDPYGDLWTNVLGALAIQYASDILKNISEGRSGWEVFEPRSTLATYTAAAVCSLIPGGSIWNALARSVMSETILWVDNILRGESSKNNFSKSVSNIANNTATDFIVGATLDNTVERFGTKEYSTSASNAIKRGSATNLRQVYNNQQRANSIGRIIGSSLRSVYEIVICYLSS